jgi:hypothetical protein
MQCNVITALRFNWHFIKRFSREIALRLFHRLTTRYFSLSIKQNKEAFCDNYLCAFMRITKSC